MGSRRTVKKTTSIPETKKKEELSMKLLDDPKITQPDTPLSQAPRRCRRDGVKVG
jgi:hypothetical protein